MKHSTSKPTQAEAERMDALKELGCIACILDGRPYKVEAEIHHYKSGNRRIGHLATVPLCCWHHSAIPWFGCSTRECFDEYGPSFHKHTREFRTRYGSDAELIQMANEMIGWSQ